MEVLDQMKSDDLKKLEQEMYEKVLDVRRYPSAMFASKVITIHKANDDLFRVNLVGELSFHAVKRDHSVDARVVKIRNGLRVPENSPYGNLSTPLSRFRLPGECWD